MMKAKTGKMMKAMGGKMAKGYSKGGTKMMKAKVGRAITGDRAVQARKKQQTASFTKAAYMKALESVGARDRLTMQDVTRAARTLKKATPMKKAQKIR
jgi:hypothetical protein